MRKDKMHQINIRLNEKNFGILNRISDESSQSPSTMGSIIINQWLDIYHCKVRRGDIMFSQPILKRLLDSLDRTQIDDISEFMANHIIKEIKMQEGEVNYHNLIEHILKWNKANHLPLNKISKKNNVNKNSFNQTNLDESDVFVSRHTLGRNWSEIECKTYKNAFELIGRTIMSSEYDDDTFSFEVIKKRELTN